MRCSQWFATERAALVAAVRLAAKLGDAEHAWQLVWAIATYLDRTGDWHEMAVVTAISLKVATSPAAAGRIHHLAGRATLRLGLAEDALGHFHRALELLEGIGEERGLAATHSAIGTIYSESGAVEDALHHHRRARALWPS